MNIPSPLIKDLAVRDHAWLVPLSKTFDKKLSILEQEPIKSFFHRYFPNETIRFKKNAQGKPFFIAPSTEIQFSVSHTKEFILLGLSLDEIGVDIEKIQYRQHFRGIARKYFREEINSQRQFFYSWCAREAFIKAKGEKIATHLARISRDKDTIDLFFDKDWTGKHKVDYVYVYPGFLAALSRPKTNVKRCALFGTCRF